MKTTINSIVFTLLFCNIYSQTLPKNGGEFDPNQDKIQCLNEEQRQLIKNQLTQSTNYLKLKNKLIEPSTNRGVVSSFIWPVKKAKHITYKDVWGISNYVDHNTSYPNQLTDYNCGTKTYDTSGGYNHQGIDIFNWPFSWHTMDNNGSEIIAAEAGQIIYKHDGEYDRNCGFVGTWNAVYIQHADGSVAWYGHMKNGSLTSKNVGDMVSQGEFLGVIGSSGNSTGPHLHFEVYLDNSYTQLIDPYSGGCNSLNANSWWQSQKPYTNTNINALLTHSAPPVFPSCPDTETTNISNQFDVNSTVYFGLYLRDQLNGTSANLKIIRPNGTFAANWNNNFTNTYNAAWWYWSTTVNEPGVWKWEVTYEGQTVTHSFDVSHPLSVKDNLLENVLVYPNPFNNYITILPKSQIKKATIVNILGKTIKVFEEKNIGRIELGSISKGLYFITLEGDNYQTKTVKLIKK